MSYILDISTAVPEYQITQENFVKFYSRTLESIDPNTNSKKLHFLGDRTKIIKRYSCIPDFSGGECELFTDGNFKQSVERRTEVYKEKILPLSAKAIDKLFTKTGVLPHDITHIITVSCTGVFAPGVEFLIAKYYGMQHAEKLALNFLGCYAAVKAIKHAHFISQAYPDACVLIISAELSSLHFNPSNEDIVANLLFADGAAAAIVCGDESRHLKNKLALSIDWIGSSCFTGTADLMTWNISSSAFRMYLNKEIVGAIKANIASVVNDFLMDSADETDYWAIHPGGVKIVQAVQESLGLSESNVEDSLYVLQEYGNMSSPTILFILSRIFNKIKKGEFDESKKIFACAFGPGISIEMLRLTSVDTSPEKQFELAIPKSKFFHKQEL